MTPPYEARRGAHVVSDDPARLDVPMVHAFLTTSYWSPGITLDEVRRSIAHSHPFGLYDGDGRQVGFARVLTDRVKMAYLADVFVLPEARGGGLGVFLVESLLAHPDFAGVWRWMLLTADAHGLYARFGFSSPDRPERVMTWQRRAPSPSPSTETGDAGRTGDGGDAGRAEIVEMGGEAACQMHLLADPDG